MTSPNDAVGTYDAMTRWLREHYPSAMDSYCFQDMLACFEAGYAFARSTNAASLPETFTLKAMMPEGLHPATKQLVFGFACALANKLHTAEKKYGYSDGWLDSGWMDECRAKLREHIEKGDPRDVAAYCAFLWHHKQSTASLPSEMGHTNAGPTVTVMPATNAGPTSSNVSPVSASEAKWRSGMAALEQRIHDFIRTNPRDLDDWREEMDVLRTLVKAYREAAPLSPAAAPEVVGLLREIGDMFAARLDVPYPQYTSATQCFLTVQIRQLRERIDAVAPQPQAATTEDADCATCEGDPEVCAKVPGLRHCEKAMREATRPTKETK